MGADREDVAVTGLEKLVEFLFGWVKYLKFWTVIDIYERGCLYHLGIPTRELEPGLHFYLPFGIHEVSKENIVVNTKTVDVRTPTKDGIEVVGDIVIGWAISDVTKFLNEVEDAETAILNLVAPAGRKVLQSKTWEQIYKTDPEDLDQELTRMARSRKPGRFGIRLEWVELSELSRSRTIRLLQ